MHPISYAAVLTAVLLGAASANVVAGEVALQSDGSTVWQAGVDGVEIEWKEDGSVKRIYSRYATPVEFLDRRGIAKAQVIAEEKAKANIVRFMEQTIASTRIVAEIQSDLNKAVQTRRTGTPANISKTDERTLVEALTEVTASFAAGTLRGVIVLEKGYDQKTHEAWVVVGISEKTIAAARAAQKMTVSPTGPSPKTQIDTDPLTPQPSEVRRSRQKDW